MELTTKRRVTLTSRSAFIFPVRRHDVAKGPPQRLRARLRCIMTVDEGNAVAPLGQGRLEYRRPPIVEALCQFNFASPLRWSPVLPGMFYERIRAEYSGEPEVQQQVQANFQFPNDAAGEAQFNLGQGEQRLIYKNATKDKLIVLSPSTVSANSLPPYEGWPSLLARFESSLGKTKAVLRDVEVASVTVRYINRIFIPMREPIDLEQYFDLPFRAIGGERAVTTSMFQRFESALDGQGTTAVRTFSSVESTEDEQDGSAFVLDLEFRRELDTPATFHDALGITDELKSAENLEFETSITDRTRELFR